MKKKTKLILVVALLAALSAGGYLFTTARDKEKPCFETRENADGSVSIRPIPCK